MLGAEDPATARISSIVALPTRKSSLMICSEREFNESAIRKDSILSHLKMISNASEINPIFWTYVHRSDHILDV
jgi:hypothetical protein